jgi:uncharacterized protein
MEKKVVYIREGSLSMEIIRVRMDRITAERNSFNRDFTAKNFPQSSLKLLGAFLTFLLAVYCAACVFLYIRQAHYIFVPERDIKVTPADFQLNYQDIYIPVSTETGKTEKIHGWWIPNANKNAKTLLYLHGNSVSVGANAEHATRLHNLGFSVLLIDYRGFGRSEGEFPSESQVYEDAQTAWNYLVKEQKARNIFIYGHSLGGAVAVDLAVHHPEAAGLIVESSFTSLLDLASHYPWTQFFPMPLLLTQRFDSLSKVKYLKVPVLFIHGTADQTISFQMSQRLFAAAPAPKQLELVPNADHGNDAIVAGPRYLEVVRNFVQTASTTTSPVVSQGSS